MDKATTLPLTEARKKFFQIADKVEKDRARFTLTDRGTPKAILMSVEEFESWLETLEVMREFPSLENEIKQAQKDFKNSAYITLEEILAKEGFILADKPREGYVPSRSRPKGRKRP